MSRGGAPSEKTSGEGVFYVDSKISRVGMQLQYSG